jgi:hypothetical protein
MRSPRCHNGERGADLFTVVGRTNISSLRHLKLFCRPQVLSKDLAQWRVASVSPFSLTSRLMTTS